MKFATLHDVAETAGVSYATVDRVVNRRGGVAHKSVVRVQDAIEKLGYVRDETAANPSLIHITELTRLLSNSYAGFRF